MKKKKKRKEKEKEETSYYCSKYLYLLPVTRLLNAEHMRVILSFNSSTSRRKPNLNSQGEVW